MLAAMSIVFNTEEGNQRLQRKRLRALADELLARASRGPRERFAAILQCGSRLVLTKPNSLNFDYAMGMRGALLVGTYDFTKSCPIEWELEANRAIADLAAALTEYHEERYSHPPGAPGEH
jgi:hypothetical protein